MIVRPVTTVPASYVSASAVPLLRSPVLHWRVHSVFRQALNVDAAGRLIAVAPQAVGGLPNGIAVVGNPDFLALGVAVGMPMGGAWPLFEIQAVLRLDLARAWSWSARLPTGTLDAHDPMVRARADLAAGIVAARATRVGFGQGVGLLRPADRAEGHLALPIEGAAARAGLRAIEAMRDAVTASDEGAAFSAADRLVGLGDGLTPSGDDFLVGLSAALRAAGHPLAGPLSSHAASRSHGATTDVARAAHEHAARGEYAERLHEVLDALAHGDEDALRLHVQRVLDWGASSGADALLGVLVGLEAAGAS